MEIARGLLVPDLMPPDRETLLTALLVYDGLDVPTYGGEEASLIWQPQDANDELVVAMTELGLICSIDRAVPPLPQQDIPTTVAPPGWVTEEQLAYRVTRLGDRLLAFMQDAHELSGQLAAAPISTGLIGYLTGALPLAAPDAPVREAALVTTSLRMIRVDASTPIEIILDFREKHAREMARLRASLIDLASRISDSPDVTSIFSQAEALVSNRVEPAIADLQDALDENRIKYVWRSVLGGSAIAGAPTSASVVTAGAMTFATRSIAYAFDRKRLVAEHPYGYLHLLGGKFDVSSKELRSPRPIRDPRIEVRGFLDVFLYALMRPDAMIGRMDRVGKVTRVTPPSP